MLGVGGLATVWLSAYFGRLPVLFWFGCLSAGTAAWSAAAQSFESYMASRILNGLFCVAAAGGGLMWIKDVWFWHQHAKKINIWSTAIILSPFLGPQFMAAIVSVTSWRKGMWLDFGIIALGLALTFVFGDETFYPRHLMPDRIPKRKSRLLRVIGVEQYKTKYTTNTFWEAGSRLGYTALKLPVFLICLFYFFDCMEITSSASWLPLLTIHSPVDDWQQHDHLGPDHPSIQLQLSQSGSYLHCTGDRSYPGSGSWTLHV